MLSLLVAVLLGVQPATGHVTGVVVESRTGAPLAAVLVKVQATGQQALSGSDGHFAIADVRAGSQTLLVSVVGYGLVHHDVTVVAGEAVDVTIPVAEGASGYVEDVTVGAPVFRQSEPGIASQAVLGSRDLLALRGVIADDPFRAVQVLPTVASGDDFRAEFAVRALGPQHVGVAIDGIDSSLLFHTVRGVDDTGSLAIINSDILQSATLVSGAYPQVGGSHLGARLDFATRDGARDRLTARALVSGTAVTTVWEGPIGSGKTGAWIVAARKSYIDWLLKTIDSSIEGTFGFSDTQAKVTLDLSPRNTVQASFLGGRSLLSDADSTPGLNSLDRGRNHTVIGNVSWRFIPTPSVTTTQQFYVVEGRYTNTVPDGRTREEGRDREMTWRGASTAAIGAHHVIEFGAQAQHLRAKRFDQSITTRGPIVNLDTEGAHTSAAAWVHYRWSPTPALTISPGARVDHFGLVQDTEVSPWLLAEWQVARHTRLRVSSGRQHQSPTFDQAIVAPSGSLLPEEATTFDFGIEQRVGEGWRLNVTGYLRDDDQRLRYENSEYRLVGGRLVRPVAPRWANTLTGRARGLEAVVERRVTNGVSGWLSYAYGDSQMVDASTRETFAADYDQTHMVNAYGIYRASNSLGVSARFRYGSNFPIHGYYDQVGDAYVAGSARNIVRLPAYARLDLRGDWAFTYRRSRLTLFVEVVNALSRHNLGPSDWSLNTATGVYRNVVQPMFPLLPSVGVLIEF